MKKKSAEILVALLFLVGGGLANAQSIFKATGPGTITVPLGATNVLCDATAGTTTLLVGSNANTTRFNLQKIDASTNACVFTPNSGKVDSSSTVSLTLQGGRVFSYDPFAQAWTSVEYMAPASAGTSFNPAAPGAIGGTTPAAGTFHRAQRHVSSGPWRYWRNDPSGYNRHGGYGLDQRQRLCNRR